jgi:hypothetical protein
MAVQGAKPGPNARAAFSLGIRAAAAGGLGGLGLLYLYDLIDLSLLVFVLVVLFPIYLVVAASVLSVWLGYDKDAGDLRPVTRKQQAK